MTAPDKTATSTIIKNNRVALLKGKATARDLLVKGQKYTVNSLIAKGGMAEVFEAKDKNCRRKVALKIIRDSHSQHSEVIHRFIEEAQIAAQLDHPNILPIYDLSLDDEGKPFYAMKMVKGYTLEEILQKIRCENREFTTEYSLSRLLQVFIKICEAVQFAASKGVVHRDLKPENIMIGKFGEVFIMDWGIAKILEESIVTNKASDSLESIIESIKHDTGEFTIATTMQGQILGTPSFMAPEQVYSEDGEIDTRADVYALGGILYNILVLDTPHSEMNIKDLLRNKIVGKFPTPEKRAAQTGSVLNHLPGRKIPPALSAVCQKALSIKAEKRYQSAKELQEDVEAFTNGFATQAEGASQAKLVRLLFLRHRRLSFELILLISMVILYLTQNYYKLQFAQIESETATTLAEEVVERKAKSMDEMTKVYKIMNMLQPEALIKIENYLSDNELDKALTISNQYSKVADRPDFHLKKAEILIKLSRPRSAMITLHIAKEKFPNDTKVSEMIDSLKP